MANDAFAPFDAAAFVQSLRDAAAWCERHDVRAWPNRALRDARLQPTPPPFTDTAFLPPAAMAATVADVIARRRALLGTAAEPDQCSGRIVACDYTTSFFDTLPQSSSDGFFDEGDLPPWDLWLGLLHVPRGGGPWLLAFVPRDLIAAVDAGIAVSCTDNLAWVRDPVRGPDLDALPTAEVLEAWLAGLRPRALPREWTDAFASEPPAISGRRAFATWLFVFLLALLLLWLDPAGFALRAVALPVAIGCGCVLLVELRQRRRR